MKKIVVLFAVLIAAGLGYVNYERYLDAKEVAVAAISKTK